MEFPLKTPREKKIGLGLLALWALLFLPNLRTSPNWYGDEGEWMEKCWQFIHGTTHIGPINNDFVYPYPYPPLYMLINGLLLRIFGDDLVVGRALGAVTALVAAMVLFWIGSRIKNKNFGFLAAGAFLCYSEADVNFRWVRSHPFAGMLALVSVGFLVRYVQEKKWRDALWAGLFCSLATGTHYFTYPLIGGVGLTVLIVNIRDLKQPRAWGHIITAGVAACAFAGLFVLWYTVAHSWGQLMKHVELLLNVAGNQARPGLAAEVERFVTNVLTLGFRTPVKMTQQSVSYDWWLRIATVGFLWMPVQKNKWLRAWLPFWLLVLMYSVFKKLDNVPLFFYPATIFLPLMALGFASTVYWAGSVLTRVSGKNNEALRWAPGVVAVAIFALMTAEGALGHFNTKIDMWSQRSPQEAEAAMQYVNSHSTADDIVVVPKQIYWLVKDAKRSMLTYCARYEGIDNDMPVPTPIARDLFWFDCRWQNVKYVVMASGIDETGRIPSGIDLVYCRGLKGVPEVVGAIMAEKWPVVFPVDKRVGIIPMGPGVQWPVVVGGEYLVLANPRFVKDTK